MTRDELENLFAYTDTSPNAISKRLIAARKAVGMKGIDVAAAIGIPKQTYHSQEARGAPSVKTGRYFLRAHGIDFNYLYYGDFDGIDPKVIDQLIAALSDATA